MVSEMRKDEELAKVKPKGTMDRKITDQELSGTAISADAYHLLMERGAITALNTWTAGVADDVVAVQGERMARAAERTAGALEDIRRLLVPPVRHCDHSDVLRPGYGHRWCDRCGAFGIEGGDWQIPGGAR